MRTGQQSFASRPLNGRSASLPPPDHPAISRRQQDLSEHGCFTTRALKALKSGSELRKIGAVVLKGEWRDFPIYVLNLEERRTCPPHVQALAK